MCVYAGERWQLPSLSFKEALLAESVCCSYQHLRIQGVLGATGSALGSSIHRCADGAVEP